ncbi:MAG TPA: hypothetical protein VMW10_04060 [Alphaproteobacteria bacterium]|nr:hypothetical protein [Alphaproteobacteria bacterium]
MNILDGKPCKFAYGLNSHSLFQAFTPHQTTWGWMGAKAKSIGTWGFAIPIAALMVYYTISVN